MLALSQPDSCAPTAAKTPEREADGPPSAAPPVQWHEKGKREGKRGSDVDKREKKRAARRCGRQWKRALGVNKTSVALCAYVRFLVQPSGPGLAMCSQQRELRFTFLHAGFAIKNEDYPPGVLFPLCS